MAETQAVLVEVTQEDIDRGCKRHRNNCPVARAVKRSMRSGLMVSVAASILIYSLTRSYSTGINALAEAKKFVDDFDAGLPVQPFSFTLDIPTWALKDKTNG